MQPGTARLDDEVMVGNQSGTIIQIRRDDIVLKQKDGTKFATNVRNCVLTERKKVGDDLVSAGESKREDKGMLQPFAVGDELTLVKNRGSKDSGLSIFVSYVGPGADETESVINDANGVASVVKTAWLILREIEPFSQTEKEGQCVFEEGEQLRLCIDTGMGESLAYQDVEFIRELQFVGEDSRAVVKGEDGREIVVRLEWLSREIEESKLFEKGEELIYTSDISPDDGMGGKQPPQDVVFHSYIEPKPEDDWGKLAKSYVVANGQKISVETRLLSRK